MFTAFLTNKWFFVIVGMVIVIGFGCYLWLQNDLANFRQQHAPISQIEKSAETEQIAHLQTDQINTHSLETHAAKNGSASKDTDDDTHKNAGIGMENTKIDADATLEGAGDQIAATEKAQEILSSEELREQELKKRLNEIFAQMRVLTEKAGGRVNASSDPEVRHEMQQLTTEMFQIMQEGGKEEDQPVLTFFMNLMTMGNNLVNSKGELIVSEYIKIADNMEAAGMNEMAKGIRTWAQNAIDNGYEVIKPGEIQNLMGAR